MADEHELTPEEKLLRVIQKGESTPPGALNGTPGGAAPYELVADDPPEATGNASGVTPVGRGILILNRSLALAALIFLILAGYETYLNVPASATVYPPASIEIGNPAADLPAVSLGDTLDMFAQRRIFGQMERSDVVNPVGTNTVNLLGWRAYARDNLSLMGMSDIKLTQDGTMSVVREAIVMDNKSRKMHFLRTGATLVLAEQEVSVSSIGDTIVELKKGDEILRIE